MSREGAEAENARAEVEVRVRVEAGPIRRDGLATRRAEVKGRMDILNVVLLNVRCIERKME
jgi:hypothetical protein